MSTGSAPATVVLVHGGFVDGSGWQGVYDLLKADGYRVRVVQNPTLSLDGDVAATRWVTDAQDGPVVLVGHSDGGAVITEAGTHQNVAALVYIAAFVPDKDESVNTLIGGIPAGGPQPPILPPRDSFLLLDQDKFRDREPQVMKRTNRNVRRHMLPPLPHGKPGASRQQAGTSIPAPGAGANGHAGVRGAAGEDSPDRVARPSRYAMNCAKPAPYTTPGLPPMPITCEFAASGMCDALSAVQPVRGGLSTVWR
jgi:pimeloyl-ACP methyl ester carboxylesterase